MAKIKGAVVVNTERCKGCNLCVVACPSDVLELHPREVNNKGYHYVYMKNPDGKAQGHGGVHPVLAAAVP